MKKTIMAQTSVTTQIKHVSSNRKKSELETFNKKIGPQSVLVSALLLLIL